MDFPATIEINQIIVMEFIICISTLNEKGKKCFTKEIAF